MGEIPSPKVLKTFPGALQSSIVKEKNIGSAVSEIFRYRQKSLLLYIIGLYDAGLMLFLLDIISFVKILDQPFPFFINGLWCRFNAIFYINSSAKTPDQPFPFFHTYLHTKTLIYQHTTSIITFISSCVYLSVYISLYQQQN